jgi:hypothetical protein
VRVALNSVDLQAVHVLSNIELPDAVKYSPAGHVVFFAEQAVTASVPTLNSVDLQVMHVLSVVESGDAVKYWPAGHSVTGGVNAAAATMERARMNDFMVPVCTTQSSVRAYRVGSLSLSH